MSNVISSNAIEIALSIRRTMTLHEASFDRKTEKHHVTFREAAEDALVREDLVDLIVDMLSTNSYDMLQWAAAVLNERRLIGLNERRLIGAAMAA